MTQMSKAERDFHETGQRNALGTFIGCPGPVCAAREKAIADDNAGRKIQGV